MATWTPDYNPNMAAPEGGFTVGQLLAPNYLSYQTGDPEGGYSTSYRSLDLGDAEGSFAAFSPNRSLREAISDVAPGFQLPAGGPIDWGSVLNSQVAPWQTRAPAADPWAETLLGTGASFFISGLPGMMGEASALSSLWDQISGIAGGGTVAPTPDWADTWGDIGGLENVGPPLSANLAQLASPNWADTWADLPGLSTSGAFGPDSFLGPGFSSSRLAANSLGGSALSQGFIPGGATLSPIVAGGASPSGLSSLFESIFGQMDPDLKRKLGLGMGGASALLSLLSAGMGLKGAKDIRAAASSTPQMAPIYDPFASQRGFYQQQLQGLASDPSKVFELPGYKAGEQALMRQLAAGGYLGSGNMAVALRDYGTKAYGEEFDRLAGLAGAKIGPMVAGSAPNPYAGAVAANDATSKALASLGYLARMW